MTEVTERPLTLARPGHINSALTVAELQAALRTARATHIHECMAMPALDGVDELYVVAAHPGAGCSAVALALADAATEPVQLVECCPPQRSGLAGASDTELGPLPDGYWRRGRRGAVVIDRPIASMDGSVAPPLDGARLRVLDVGTRPPASGGTAVLVCRATVPGLHAADSHLARYGTEPVAMAVLGPPRWDKAVRASVGPRLCAVREDGRLVSVPLDRRLATTGPTRDRLPRGVLAAARRLLALTPISV